MVHFIYLTNRLKTLGYVTHERRLPQRTSRPFAMQNTLTSNFNKRVLWYGVEMNRRKLVSSVTGAVLSGQKS